MQSPSDEPELAYATNQLLQQLIKRTNSLSGILMAQTFSVGHGTVNVPLACSMHNFMQWIEPALRQDPNFEQYDLRLSEPRGYNNCYLSQFILCGAHVRVANSPIQADLDLDRLQAGKGKTHPEWLGSIVRVGVRDYHRSNDTQFTWQLGTPCRHGEDTNLPHPVMIQCSDPKAYRDWIIRAKLSV